MKCLNCDTDVISKRSDAKFCGPKCKLQYSRNNKSPKRIIDTDNSKKHDTDSSEPLPPVDKLFAESHPGYYKFGKIIYTRKCLICGKDFKTTLQLLKTCSPNHYEQLILSFSEASKRSKIIR